MQIVFDKPARKDIDSAYDWYEEKQIGLGNRFLKEVVEYSQKLKKPDIEYRKYTQDIQYIRLRKFLFSIFFIKESNVQIIIIGVLFNRKDIMQILQKRK